MITLARRAARTSTSTPKALGNERRIIEALLDAHDDARRRHPLITAAVSVALVLLVARTIATVGAWIAGYPLAPGTALLGPVTHTLLFVGFAAVGLLLVCLGRNRRTTYLGAAFVVISLAFSREALRQAPVPGWLDPLFRRSVDPLLPFFLWLFVREFPHRRSDALDRVAGVASVLSAIAALAMMFAPALWTANAYWSVTFGLTATSLLTLWQRGRAATGAERLRVQWVGAGLLAGFAPLVLEVLAAAVSPAFGRWSERPDVIPILGFAVAGALLSIPLTTSYAVLTRRVVDVDWAVRRAVRSRLAKILVIAAALAPLVVLTVVAYANRVRSIAEVANQPAVIVLLILAAAGIGVLMILDRLFRLVDRVFRQPHDAASAAVVAAFAADAPLAANISALGDMVARAVTTALAPSRVRIAISRAPAQGYVDNDTGQRVFGPTSELVDLLARSRQTPIDVGDSLLRVMNYHEAASMSAGLAEIIAPIRTAEGYVVGVVTLSARDDERLYTPDDRLVIGQLMAIAATAAERLELRRASTRFTLSMLAEDLPPASECPCCGVVYAPTDKGRCDACEEPLRRACVPHVIGGKLRVERCAGRGGMSVVYVAFDEALQRRVAVKALPYVSGAAEERLRYEAQTMARVAHVNVAGVYGLESWNRRPLVVVEFLEGGTLAERLRHRASVRETVAWGLALAEGLAHLHRDGLLHGDIKPSNIGFDRNGVPKLLDFGLAQSYLSTTSEVRIGTPTYLCPDAAGAAPRPEFDLWSLAVVLYEALGGTDISPALAEFFTRALHSRSEFRPKSASEFSLWLQRAGAIG